MFGSGDTGVRTVVGRLVRRLDTLSRYDLLLALVPAALFASVLVGRALALPVETALAAGGAVGALAVVDALFVDPPSNSGA